MTQTTITPTTPSPPAQSRQTFRLPVALTALAVVLGTVFVGVVLPAHRDAAANTFSDDESAAMSAASVVAANLLSYRRATFEADFARALAGTTGDLRSDMEGMADKTLQTMTDGKFDLTAKVREVALEPTEQRPDAVRVLVVVAGSTVDDAGTATPVKVERVELTMKKTDGGWRAAALAVTDGVVP